MARGCSSCAVNFGRDKLSNKFANKDENNSEIKPLLMSNKSIRVDVSNVHEDHAII